MTETKEEVQEIIFGICPSKSNSYRIGHKGLFKTKSLTEYEDKFFIQCRNRNKAISGYFALEVKVFYPSQRADLDNALKVILDCLQKCKVIVNDNKCIRIVADKFLDKKNPRIEITLKDYTL